MVLSLGERSISDLSYEELEELCDLAEEAARRYIASRVPKEYISDLSISVDLEGSETLNIDVDVEVRLSPLCKNIDARGLAEGSVRAAFDAIEEYLRRVRVHASPK